MEVYTMQFHITRQDLIRGVQEEFSKTYPFLKIEFSEKGGRSPEGKISPDDGILHSEDGVPAMDGLHLPKLADLQDNGMAASGEDSDRDQDIRSASKKLLLDFGHSDDMKVTELEILLQYQFGLPVQILRKSGNLWMETRMSRGWTLRQQNDHGKDITSGFE